MATTVRATIIQPDPLVPLGRFSHWLGINRILVRGVPLWKSELPELDEVGDGVLLLGGTMSAHDGATHPWIDPLKQLLVQLVEAEVPVLARLDGRQISGAIDRLIVTPERILAVDFKSNRVVPNDAADIPEGILRQLGAYEAALTQIWPDRPVEVAIIWTRTAQLMPVPCNIVRAALQRAAIS